MMFLSMFFLAEELTFLFTITTKLSKKNTNFIYIEQILQAGDWLGMEENNTKKIVVKNIGTEQRSY